MKNQGKKKRIEGGREREETEERSWIRIFPFLITEVQETQCHTSSRAVANQVHFLVCIQFICLKKTKREEEEIKEVFNLKTIIIKKQNER